MQGVVQQRLLVPFACFAAAIVAMGITSPGSAAPLNPAATPAVSDRQGLVSLPARRPTPGATMADQDRDGLSDGLQEHLASLRPGEQVEVIVTADRRGASRIALDAVGGFSVTHEFARIHAFTATMTGAQARALAQTPGIIRVEQNVPYSATLEVARRDFRVEEARALLQGSGLSGTGDGVSICVVDTGVDATHEQFVDGAGASKVAGFIDLIGDINGVKRTSPYDDHGHGSHVSNIAAGDGTPSTGLAGRFRGVAPGATLFVAKVLDYQGSGADGIVMQGIEWCADQMVGGGVINLSLASGTSSDGRDAMSLLVNALVADGIVVVVGAGNGGAEPGTIGSPAAAARAITVGAAAEWSGDPNDLWFSGGVYPAPFSARGPTADGRLKPDLLAPGVSIAAAYVENILTGPFPCWAPCYAVVSGTSMASPFVAGIAALMLEADGSLGPDDVRRILFATAQDRFPRAGKDPDTGYGLVDAFAAVEGAFGGTAPSSLASPSDVSGRATVPDHGEALILVDVVDPSKPLAITLTLDGRNGRLGWSPDLDAEVLDQNGEPLTIPGIPPEWGLRPAGSVSTCPAGGECGAVGRQETLFVAPPLDLVYYVRVYTFEGRPNRGAGGDFDFELSNGTTGFTATDDEPQGGLLADAGPAITVPDDGSGTGTVYLDGSNSTGAIDSYSWSVDIEGTPTIVDNIFGTLTLPLGDNVVTLTVLDAFGASDSDVVTVTVGDGGGGNGGKKGGGNNGGGKGGKAGS
jgi:serine protease AprX